MSVLEKTFNCLGAASRIHSEFESWEKIEYASVSFIIVQTLPESTKILIAVFPSTTGRLIASIGVLGSAEDTDATQLLSSDSKSGSKSAEI